MADWDEPQNPTATERADAKAYQGRIADLERKIAELRAEYLSASKDAMEFAGKLNAAEAESARLRALPLKDEVERVVEPFADACGHFDGHVKDDDNVSLALRHIKARQLRAARSLLSRLRAGEQEGWRSQAADDVLAERKRQVSVEGWTPEHDNVHSDGQMATAAACYAKTASMPGIDRAAAHFGTPIGWPWGREWWKPKDRRRDLVRAAALLVAEIERLDRLPAAPKRGEAK